MIRIFTSLIVILLSIVFGMAQTPISGIINNYGAVINIDNSNICDPTLTVDDATGFAAGDFIMIIQMKGASIDTTNSSTFGSITNINSAGLYEKAQIESVTGNDIILSTLLTNSYNVSGFVQIVSMPQYQDVTLTAPVYAMPWNGVKGGVISIEVAGTLSLDFNIDASESGFRGGVRETIPSECSASTEFTDYYYPYGNFRGATKGEGITDTIPGKEKGRGALATGGGGGNDHNTGGGGGSNFGSGGTGGLNLTPTPTTCIGLFSGRGGYANLNITNRLFMGGGGGAGHDNNDAVFEGGGTDGAVGGGIIYIKANEIIGWWNYIRANGKTLFATPGFDGGGGGGAGGTIMIDCPTLTYGLFLEARGGKGCDMNALGNDICMGTGGGGGGGVIYTDIPFADVSISIEGGLPGTIINGTSCNGSTMSALAGGTGTFSTFPGIIEGIPVEHIAITDQPNAVSICDSDPALFSVMTDITATSYQWQINDGSGYTNIGNTSGTTGANSGNLNLSNLSPGTYTVSCIIEGGCDDVLETQEVLLEVSSSAMIDLEPMTQTICEGEEFILTTSANGSNLIYQWQLDNGAGFNNLSDDATYSGSTSNTLVVQADLSMNGHQFQCLASNDCPGMATTTTATLNINPLAIADFSYTVSNDTVYINNASSGEDNYYWDFGDGTPLHPGGTPYYVYENSGTYDITIYAINDCGTSTHSIPVTISIVTGLNNIEQEVAFSISPNPTSDIIRIDLSTENFNKADLFLYDVTGKRISQQLTEDSVSTLDLSIYPTGVYFLQIVIEGRTSIAKVVKQ